MIRCCSYTCKVASFSLSVSSFRPWRRNISHDPLSSYCLAQVLILKLYNFVRFNFVSMRFCSWGTLKHKLMIGIGGVLDKTTM